MLIPIVAIRKVFGFRIYSFARFGKVSRECGALIVLKGRRTRKSLAAKIAGFRGFPFRSG